MGRISSNEGLALRIIQGAIEPPPRSRIIPARTTAGLLGVEAPTSEVTVMRHSKGRFE